MTISRKTAFGIALLVVAFLLMAPSGYFGKDVVSLWWLGVGFPLAWVGYALLWENSGSMVAIGGGFVAACVVALLGTGFGTLITGHFLRDLLCVSPLVALAAFLHRRAAQQRHDHRETSRVNRKTPLQVIGELLVVMVGLVILSPAILDSSLLDTYPYFLGAIGGLSLGYIVFRLVRPYAPGPYYVLFCIAAPLGTTAGVLVNRHWDSSEPIDHAAKVLAYDDRSRGQDICLVASWRGAWSERIGTSIVPCPVNGEIAVRTKSGVFGWPWIESARVTRKPRAGVFRGVELSRTNVN